MKKCSKCKQFLNESCFSPANGGKYLRPECRNCANILSKKRKILREKHGIPNDDYFCPICLRSESDLIGTGGKAGIWVADHSHDTDGFRGHTCHQCNRGMGLFQDDIPRLKRCIEYLSKACCDSCSGDGSRAEIQDVKVQVLNHEIHLL